MGVEAMTALMIFAVSPRFMRAFWMRSSIFATCAGEAADMSVCGSSMKTKSGRSEPMLRPRIAWSAPRQAMTPPVRGIPSRRAKRL